MNECGRADDRILAPDGPTLRRESASIHPAFFITALSAGVRRLRFDYRINVLATYTKIIGPLETVVQLK